MSEKQTHFSIKFFSLKTKQKHRNCRTWHMKVLSNFYLNINDIKVLSWKHITICITWLFVPTSSMTGSVCSGGIPPSAVYRDNFPTGIPIPYAPKSPRPKILSPSVATTACCVVN